MKSRKSTYFLMLAVLGIWGVILYRIAMGAGTDDVAVSSPAKSHANYQSLDTYKLKDTFTLALDYGDPFSENKPTADKDVETSVEPLGLIRDNAKTIRANNWNNIKYTGYIANGSAKRLVAIMTINGKQYMLSEGQNAEDVLLLKCRKDSVKISYRDEIKFMKIE